VEHALGESDLWRAADVENAIEIRWHGDTPSARETTEQQLCAAVNLNGSLPDLLRDVVHTPVTTAQTAGNALTPAVALSPPGMR
jgi:hypothetical protein